LQCYQLALLNAIIAIMRSSNWVFLAWPVAINVGSKLVWRGAKSRHHSPNTPTSATLSAVLGGDDLI
jgi:hypothetical protein